jgi:hypothetical protein
VTLGRTLWTTPAGLAPVFQLPLPANLEELAANLAMDLVSALDERTKPYRTPVTAETLRTPVCGCRSA